MMFYLFEKERSLHLMVRHGHDPYTYLVKYIFLSKFCTTTEHFPYSKNFIFVLPKKFLLRKRVSLQRMFDF